MSDGTVLAMDLHLPADREPVACLLQRVPYGKDVPAIVAGALDPARALERGYAVAVQDCRGRGRSEGEFTPFVNESSDGAETIHWLASQPWCDGRVGMFGRSYAAMCQWLVAGRDDVPQLTAIAPMFSGSDPWSDWLRPDGVAEWGFVLLWCLRYLAPEEVARREVAELPSGLTGDRLAAWIDGLGDLYRHGIGVDDGRVAQIAELMPVIAAVLAAECGDGPATSGAETTSPVSRVPALVIGGWFDIFLRGTLDTWERLAASPAAPPAHLVVGPWAHGGACPGTFAERDFGPAASAAAVGLTSRQLDWFDRWMPTTADVPDDPLPAARVFDTGTDTWRDEPLWPPSDVRTCRWYLTPGHDAAALDGRLRHHAVDSTGSWELAYDEATPVPTVGGQTFLPGLDVAANAGPRNQHELLGRGDVLAFVGDERSRSPMQIVGAPAATLAVSGAPPESRWCLRLVDVGPDGWILLAESATRARTDATTVHIRLPGIAHTILAGHRIAIVISHTSFPRYGAWIGEPHAGPARRGSSYVHHGPGVASYVDVPIRHPQEVPE